MAARPELFNYPGSPWFETNTAAYREHLTEEGWNSPGFALRYGLLCPFGPRGFLVYNPLIWVSLFYAVGGVADPWPRPNLMGYLTPWYNINRMRAPCDGLTIDCIAPNQSRDRQGAIRNS